MILNNIDIRNITFDKSYYIFRAFRLIEKWNFLIIDQNNSVFKYKHNTQDFKSLIKKLYYTMSFYHYY